MCLLIFSPKPERKIITHADLDLPLLSYDTRNEANNPKQQQKMVFYCFSKFLCPPFRFIMLEADFSKYLYSRFFAVVTDIMHYAGTKITCNS